MQKSQRSCYKCSQLLFPRMLPPVLHLQPLAKPHVTIHKCPGSCVQLGNCLFLPPFLSLENHSQEGYNYYASDKEVWNIWYKGELRRLGFILNINNKILMVLYKLLYWFIFFSLFFLHFLACILLLRNPWLPTVLSTRCQCSTDLEEAQILHLQIAPIWLVNPVSLTSVSVVPSFMQLVESEIWALSLTLILSLSPSSNPTSSSEGSI